MTTRVAISVLVALVGCDSPATTGDAATAEDAADDAADDAEVDADILVPFAEIDLGGVTTGTAITFTIPDRTLGFTLLAEVASGPIGIERLTAPNGDHVIDNFAMLGRTWQVFQSVEAIAAAVPQSDFSPASIPPTPGMWTVRLGGATVGSSATLRLYVRRSEDGAFHGGTVNAHVFLAPASGVTQQHMMGAMATAAMLYTVMFPGLSLGTVTFSTLPAAYDSIDSQAELRAMFRSSAGQTATPQLNVFAVGDFSDATFGPNTVYVAPGIPGSPMRHGTPLSGVAFQPANEPMSDAWTIGHLMGHHMGLFHTSEMAVDATDPISDTLECPQMTVAMNPGLCLDGNNTMFPWVNLPNTGLTPRQFDVVRGSALHIALP